MINSQQQSFYPEKLIIDENNFIDSLVNLYNCNQRLGRKYTMVNNNQTKMTFREITELTEKIFKDVKTTFEQKRQLQKGYYSISEHYKQKNSSNIYNIITRFFSPNSVHENIKSADKFIEKANSEIIIRNTFQHHLTNKDLARAGDYIAYCVGRKVKTWESELLKIGIVLTEPKGNFSWYGDTLNQISSKSAHLTPETKKELDDFKALYEELITKLTEAHDKAQAERENPVKQSHQLNRGHISSIPRNLNRDAQTARKKFLNTLNKTPYMKQVLLDLGVEERSNSQKGTEYRFQNLWASEIKFEDIKPLYHAVGRKLHPDKNTSMEARVAFTFFKNCYDDLQIALIDIAKEDPENEQVTANDIFTVCQEKYSEI